MTVCAVAIAAPLGESAASVSTFFFKEFTSD